MAGYPISALPPVYRDFISANQLDDGNGFIGPEDAARIQKALDGGELDGAEGVGRTQAEQLLKVARGAPLEAGLRVGLGVPRLPTTNEAIKDVLWAEPDEINTAGRPKLPSEISTSNIRALVDAVPLEAFTVPERMVMIEAMLDDFLVAPVDLWDFGFIADNEEGMIAALVATTPSHQVDELALRFESKQLLQNVLERIDKGDYRDAINNTLGQAITRTRAAVRRGELSLHGPSIRAQGTIRERILRGTADVSRYVTEEMFPTGGPYAGVSVELDTGRGDPTTARILLHMHRGEPEVVELGRLNPKRFLTNRDVYDVISNKVEEHYYGTSGARTVPPPWVNLAADLFVTTDELPGAPLRKLVKVGRRDDGSIGPVHFRMAPAQYAQLLGLPAKSSAEEVETALANKLTQLGFEKPSVTGGLSREHEPEIRLGLAEAELLLRNRAYSAKIAELGFPRDSVRLVNGEPRFVFSPETSPEFGRVGIPEPGERTAENYRAFMQERIDTLLPGYEARLAEVDGETLITVPVEAAPRLFNTTFFDFNPDATRYDVENMYWSGRFADLVYLEFDKIATGDVEVAYLLNRWGFEANFETFAKKGAEVMVATNGEMIIVACRGTAGGADIATDIDATKTELVFDGETVDAHKGFAGQVDQNVANVAAAIRRMQAEAGKPLKVWVTGHSKGGGETDVMALRLQKHFGVEIQGVNTVEGARSPGTGMAKIAAREGMAKNAYHFSNLLDPVPHMPLRKMGYQKYGRQVVFDPGIPGLIWGTSASERKGALLSDLKGTFTHMMGGVFNVMEQRFLGTQISPPLDEPLLEE